jgi:hypothetical protein
LEFLATAALLLGALLIGAIQHAVMSRADIPLQERMPFHMIIEEISSFVTGPFLELLAETRKNGVTLVMAAQSLAAMDDQFAGLFRPEILMALNV